MGGPYIYIIYMGSPHVPHVSEIREIQSNVETAKMNLKTRRIVFAKQDVNNVKSLISRYEAKLLSAVPSANLESAKNSLERLKADVVPLLSAIEQESAAGSGSLQERKGINFYSNSLRKH